MNHKRIGKFTSSKIVALMSNGKGKELLGKPFYTYVEEKKMELQLKLPLEVEIYAKSTSWGLLCEKYVMGKPDLLGIEYEQRPDEPIIHPELQDWAGTPDATTKDTVVDIKSPWTRKSFCQLVQPLYDGYEGIEAMALIRSGHPDGEKFFWQLVSNGILTNSKYAELIVFMPYFEQLVEIQEMAQASQGDDFGKFYSLAMADRDTELPYLKKDGYYKNINTIRFEIPDIDKAALTERVKKAIELL